MKRIFAIFFTVLMLMSAAGCSAQKVREGNYEKVDSKLLTYFANGEYEEARELMAANEWYTIQKMEIAKTILEGVGDEVKNQARWLQVIARIDNTLSPEIEARKNEIFTTLGVGRLYGNTSGALECWSNCTEGYAGYDFYQAMLKLDDNQALEAGKLLYNHMTNEKTREEFEIYFAYDYMQDVTGIDAQDYMERMLCAASIAHVTPASSVSSISLHEGQYGPSTYLHTDGYLNGHNYDMNVFEQLAMPQDIRDSFPQQISAGTGKKVLVLNRVDICGKDETKLYINGYMMRSLPEEYCAESLEAVDYILLLDYGYLEDGIWYAGTITARVFDVKTGEEIFTSETREGTFATSYFGEHTKVVFGSYPDTTDIIREAIAKII